MQYWLNMGNFVNKSTPKKHYPEGEGNKLNQLQKKNTLTMYTFKYYKITYAMNIHSTWVK